MRACSRSTTSPIAPPSRARSQPLCVRENVGVIPYYALAAGFLTGKYRSEADFSKSPRGGRMASYLNERGRRILKALDDGGGAL